MRYDLAFVLCCCKSFLGSNPHETNDSSSDDGPSGGNNNNNDDNDDYYHRLGIKKDATMDDIKRAYKKQSLLFHPDKLLQRNITMTAELQKKFMNIKEAYDVLSHPNQREIYNVFGKRGIQFMEEPLGSGSALFDPNVLLHNFAKSSVWDRSKIFFIFVFLFFLILIQPILICIHVDHIMRHQQRQPQHQSNKLWAVTLIPLWIWNGILLCYHIHIIYLGPIQRPDHIPIHEVWVDPLPMSKRINTMLRFLLIVMLEVFLVLKWDHVLPNLPYYIIFIPYFVLEIIGLYKKYPLSNMRIVTIHDLEVALGKPFSEFTMAEKQLIAQRYSVVSNLHCPEYYLAYQLKFRSKQEVQHAILRILFVVLLIVQFDVWQPQHQNNNNNNNTNDDAAAVDDNVDDFTINYFIIFIPIFLMSILICCTNYYNYIEIRKSVTEKDPTLGGVMIVPPTTTNNNPTTTTPEYGTMDDDTKPEVPSAPLHQQQQQYHSTLTDSEREVLQQQLYQSRQKMYQKCSIQCFLMFLLLLFVLKCNGATFTSFYILLPFLLLAGMILCCIGCAIFGVTDVSTDEFHFPNAGVVPVVDPLTKVTTNNNTTTTTTPSADDHHINAAEMGTVKPNHATNQSTTHATNQSTTTTNTSMPIIIPPPTDAVLVTDAMAEDHAVVNNSMVDHLKTTHQQPDTTSVESKKESDVHLNTTGIIGSTKDDTIVEPVITEKDAQSLTLPIALPPSTITIDNNSHDPQQPQINELD